jgi:hypothetical protein
MACWGRGRYSDHDQADADARNERQVPVRGLRNLLAKEGKEQYHDGTPRLDAPDTGAKQLDRGIQ